MLIILFLAIFFILLFLTLTLAIAYFTLLERKVLASMQRRSGPNRVGLGGLLQPIADAAKLIFKETVRPSSSDKLIFFIAPIFTFLVALMSWVVIPIELGSVISDINLAIVYLLAMSSIGVYGIIMAGWSSNSRYAFLGSLRSSAQMISYELAIGFVFLTVFKLVGSLSLTSVVCAQLAGFWYAFLNWPLLAVFFICGLAETSRPPFDLPEAESELVSGYNVEYSSAMFALFFLAEYCHILTMSALIAIIFFGGSYMPFYFCSSSPIWFSIKLVSFVFLFIWVRASLPRFRYDQLMRLGWKAILPFTIAWFAFISALSYLFDLTPPVGGFSILHI